MRQFPHELAAHKNSDVVLCVKITPPKPLAQELLRATI